jgi:nicotinate phosphoribosyltransferase
VYDLPSVMDIAKYHKQSYGEFWNEYKRMLNPHIYKVDLSQKLYDLKQSLIKENKKV